MMVGIISLIDPKKKHYILINPYICCSIQGLDGKFPVSFFFHCWLPAGFLTYPWKDPPFFIGKPSISMGHLYHGYVK